MCCLTRAWCRHRRWRLRVYAVVSLLLECTLLWYSTKACRIIWSHLFFLHERVSLSTTNSCHLAGFLLAFQSTPPLLIFHCCSKARRVRYIHRRVLRCGVRAWWYLLARVALLPCVLVWHTYVYVSFFPQLHLHVTENWICLCCTRRTIAFF